MKNLAITAAIVAVTAAGAFTGPTRVLSALGLVGDRGGPAASAPLASPHNAGRTLTLQADLRGHFTAHASVNGAVIRTIVDTGATLVALTDADARAVGAYKARVLREARFSTANGVVAGKIVRLDEIRVGDIVVRDVEAAILPRDALTVTLLGMSFLRGLRGFEISSGRLIMKG